MKNSSAIRRMFQEAQELAARIGPENVCDFSLGNPATPAPAAFGRAIEELVRTEDSFSLHGYMNNAGYPEVRAAVAENLNRRFGTAFTAEHILMTVGAAGALNVAFKTILDPGDEVAVLRPYFGEYRSYAANFGAGVVEVDPVEPSFAPDLADLEKKLTPRTKALVVNNPNNPTGVVYGADTLAALAEVLRKKQREYGHAIYLVSDEPYREIVYDGAEAPFLTRFYENTVVGYSFSKSLSVPGERIGYLAVNPAMEGAAEFAAAAAVANRVLGYVNAPSLMQQAVARCLEEPCDVAFYDRNRRLLTGSLTRMGYDFVRPQGAFYLFLRSPVADEAVFMAAAKERGVVLVAGSTFGWPGYMRLAYCVQPAVIEKSLPAFAALAQQFGLSPRA